MSVLGTIGSLLSTGLGIASSIQGLKLNNQNIENTKLNNELAQKNYDLQVANLDYQKDLQQQVFAREDNAVTRRAQDLENAGLSKTLAAGSSAGAGSVISTSAPQHSGYQMYDPLVAMQLMNASEQYKAQEISNKQAEYNLKKSKELGIRTSDSGNIATLLQLIDQGLSGDGIINSMIGSVSSIGSQIGEALKEGLNNANPFYKTDEEKAQALLKKINNVLDVEKKKGFLTTQQQNILDRLQKQYNNLVNK